MDIFRNVLKDDDQHNLLTVPGYFRDMAIISCYCNRLADADDYFMKAVDKIKTFPKEGIDRIMLWNEVSNLDEWINKFRPLCTNPSKVQEIVEQKVKQFKLEKFPNVPLIVD